MASGITVDNFVRWATYVLLAWTLPLDDFLGDMKLTPFAMVERYVADETYEEFSMWAYRGGLNFKPNSFVVLKFEYWRVHFAESYFFPHPSDIINGEISVSF